MHKFPPLSMLTSAGPDHVWRAEKLLHEQCLQPDSMANVLACGQSYLFHDQHDDESTCFAGSCGLGHVS